MASDVRITCGQADFSFGVDSSRVPLIRSAANPGGLPQNALAWLINGTTRGGGIQQRFGNIPLCKVHDGSALYQGGLLYDNSAPWLGGQIVPGGNPYLLLSIGGRTYQVRVDTDNSVVDLTGVFTLDNPNTQKVYWRQSEQFAIKQVGDGLTKPLFWDGFTLRRSNGLTGNVTYPNINELPPATCMEYYQDRTWYAQNRKYTAGDIVGNLNSGTAAYGFTDSVLKVTENPLAVGGDGFTVPSQAGLIRAFSYPISLDTTLGQGPLFIFTPKSIYALEVPVTRTQWIAATGANQPQQRVVMRTNGTVSDRSIVPVNGDLFFQSLDPAIRSYFMALRYFGTSWANPPVSNNINRVLQFNDRSLMHVASGIEFGERMYQTQVPVMTSVGIAFQALAVMDLDPISTLQEQKPPVWDGVHDGLNFLQLFSGDFGGLERAFAVVQNQLDGGIYVWELTSSARFDTSDSGNENRVVMTAETPAMDWSEYPRSQGGGMFETKRLDGLDLWMDRVFGEVIIKVQFRPDETTCWYDWDQKMICAARTSCEDANNPVCYPTAGGSEQYRNPISFGPPSTTECQLGNKRPVTIGFKFQLRIVTKGWCRIRGYQLHAVPFDIAPFAVMNC